MSLLRRFALFCVSGLFSSMDSHSARESFSNKALRLLGSFGFSEDCVYRKLGKRLGFLGLLGGSVG